MTGELNIQGLSLDASNFNRFVVIELRNMDTSIVHFLVRKTNMNRFWMC